jgi:hypothetical protein
MIEARIFLAGEGEEKKEGLMPLLDAPLQQGEVSRGGEAPSHYFLPLSKQ